MAGTDHLHELMAYLEAQGVCTRGLSEWANAMPDKTTGTALLLMERQGPAPQYTMSNTAWIRTPRFEVMCRSTAPAQGDYPDITNARNMAQAAYDALHKIGSQRIASTVSHSTGNWLSCLPQTEPSLKGRDDRGRVIFSFIADGQRQG